MSHITDAERLSKRPSTKAKRQALKDKRLAEAYERDEKTFGKKRGK